MGTVERMQTALKGTGNKSEFGIYPDAPHAFHADDRPSDREHGQGSLAAFADLV